METLTEIQSTANTWESFVRIRRNGQVFFSRAAVERLHLSAGDPIWFLTDTQDGKAWFFLRTYGQAAGKTLLRCVPGGQSLVCNHLTFSRQLFAALEKHNPAIQEYNTYKCLLATTADENGLYSIMTDKIL
ncbi:hypothetical protein HDR62_03995 [bacterium]|nr:hypothetical protein [bacterium]